EKGLQVLRDHGVEHRMAGIPGCVGGHGWCHTSPHGQQGEDGSTRRCPQLYCSFVQYTSKKVDEGMRRTYAGYTTLPPPSLCVIRYRPKERLFFLYVALITHLAAIKTTLRTLRGVTQKAVIKALNPVMRGWGQYYRTCVAQKT